MLVSRPSGPCLLCMGFADAPRENNYFLPGSGVAEPSSILLNSMTAVIAVELLLREIVGGLAPTNAFRYDRGALVINETTESGKTDCAVCGPQGEENVKSVSVGVQQGVE